MGRKRKLSEEHLQRLLERHLAGESIRSLAREANISESALRGLISTQSAQIKTAANHMVAAEQALTKLSVSAQITARTLANKTLRALDLLATGSELMAGSFARLAMAHNAQAQYVDEANPMGEKKSAEALVAMAALGKLAAQAAQVPLQLASVMRDGLSDADGDEAGVIRVVGGLPD